MEELKEFELIEASIRNSYDILVGEKTFDEIINQENIEYIMFHIDPFIDFPEDEDIDYLIAYFEQNEEYEKCARLLNLKK